MRTEIVVAITLVAGAVLVVRYVDANRYDAPPPAPQTHQDPAKIANAPSFTPRAAAIQTHWGNEVRITASRDHQFYTNADVNRSPTRFLIDTGASYVALRESDAQNAGIYTSWADYTFPVRTANGETKAAYVTLDAVEINGIRVESVKAFILPDEQLAINLLGMSFLSRIESVEARAGEMVLRG